MGVAQSVDFKNVIAIWIIIGPTSYSALRCSEGYLFFFSNLATVDNIAYAHISHYEPTLMANLNGLRANW